MSPFNQNNELIVRVLSGDASPEEANALQEWIASGIENREYFEDIKTIWEQSEQPVELSSFSIKDDWQTTLGKINVVKRKEEREKKIVQPSQLIRIAATLLIFSGAGYGTFKIFEFYSKVETSTLGALRSITLPDGSRVTLNEHSTLMYPKKFESGERVVSLQGEAFFDIKRNPEKPFIIKTGRTTTKVLGTSFTVNARADSVVVTVVTGRVALYEEKDHIIQLHPGERGKSYRAQLSKTMNTDSNFRSWQTNILTFSNATISHLAKDLSRHYKVPIVVQSEKLKSCTITAQFKDQSLDQVLKELQLVVPVSISLKGDTTLIDGKVCSLTQP